MTGDLRQALIESVEQAEVQEEVMPDITDIPTGELTETVARLILERLYKKLNTSDSLTTMDLRDISTMFKEVGAYVQKSGGSAGRGDSGLEAFINRLKA